MESARSSKRATFVATGQIEPDSRPSKNMCLVQPAARLAARLFCFFVSFRCCLKCANGQQMADQHQPTGQQAPGLALQQLQAANYYGNMPLESPLFLPIMPVSGHRIQTHSVDLDSTLTYWPAAHCTSAGGAITYHWHPASHPTAVSGQRSAPGCGRRT